MRCFLRSFSFLLIIILSLPLLSSGEALAQKAFVRDDLATSGTALEERLKRQVAVTAGADARALMRQGDALMERKDHRRALPLYNQAAMAAPRDPEVWRSMARAAILMEANGYREKYELQEQALAAAYIAYLRSDSKVNEALSLRTLALVFRTREMWRPALTTYRLSLEAEDNAEVRKLYEELRAQRGFRLTDNKTDSDSATPRACFTFSEPLARGRVDFAPYVAITGARSDTAVIAEDSQICIEGLRHGERYGIVLRQGLPSSIPGEVLAKNADYDIYVRDRSPTVRFSGKNYVLPRTGQQGLPLVSVNATKVALNVVRVGDRNLVNTVHGSDFLNQMSRSELNEIAENRGQKVWSGTMDVKSELNKDVTTAFPVSEALGRLQPGVYLLVASTVSGNEPDPSARPDDADDSSDSANSAAQWFVVSDLGLTSFSGNDGLHVLVRSLADASVLRGVEVQLIARNNEVLGTTVTDAIGHARFDAGLARGKGGLAPGLVTARVGEDYGFLDLKQSSFDLTDRGVKGRVAPEGLDAFLFTERGVYRSGETVHLTALTRDAKGVAVTGLPLTVVVKRPDGVEYRRQAVTDQGGGGRSWSIPLVGGASTGTWRVQAYADPKGSTIGEVTFLVEDYVPERLDADVKPVRPALRSGEPAEINVDARYLYGAPGADLEVGGQVTVRAATDHAIPGFKGYRIGLTDETVEAVKNDIEEKQTTNAQGRARLALTLSEPATTLPLEAEIALTISENGGRGITRTVTLPILPKGNVLGVKPLFEDGTLGEGQTATFDVIMGTGEGRRLARTGVKWTLSRITRNYKWFFKDGSWNFEAVKSSRRVSDGELNLATATAGRIETPVSWGSYRLDVRAEGTDGTETSVSFDVGYVAQAKADTPDVLDVALDKSAYAGGETMQVRLAPRFAGKATLAIVSDRVHAIQTLDLPAGGTTVPVRIDGTWGASAYVVVLAHRPLDQQAQRMPGRAIGLSWFSIGKAQRTLSVETGAPQMVRPRGKLDLPIKVSGIAAGEEAFVSVAAVDIGILNLTRYGAPNPVEHYFGQRQLAGELRDLYGYLIDGMQGTRGAFRSGGDANQQTTAGDKPTQEPLARYSGVVKVGADGMANVSFDLPAFNGAVKVMAVAWSKSQVGQAASDVFIRDPVVVQATLPRFLAIGDQSRFHVEVNNVEADAAEYQLEVDVKGPVTVAAEAARRTFLLNKGQKTQVTIPVLSAGLGTASFGLRLSGGGQDLSQEVRVKVLPSAQALANRTVRPLPAGGSITISPDLLADMVPGSGRVAVSVSPFAALDVPALLKALDRYPYGCTEQTISRAMPLLYVNKLASIEQLAMDETAEARVASAIDKVLSRQGANGSFGLWSVGGDDLWLDAFVTDFLTRAREQGKPVPVIGFNLALDRLRNQVVNTSEVRAEEAAGMAYALYVLARNGRPVMGDLRYLADNKLRDFATPMAKGQIGAALALLGDRGRAKTAFDQAVTTLASARSDSLSRPDYGSLLRDGSGLLTLLAEAGGERAELMRVSTAVERARGEVRFSSTQEQTWMVMAAQALAKEVENFQLVVDGASRSGAYYRTFSEEQLEAKSVVINNPGQAAARAVITVSGASMQPLPALEQGFKVERTLYSMKGQPVNWTAIRQNERYVVHLKVTEPKASYGRIMLVDPLPAGLEIENPALTEGAQVEGLAVTKSEIAPVHTEARDDRFVAAFDRNPTQKTEFSAAYVVRAVTPGRYVHPAAAVEDMYRPDRFGRGASGVVEVQAAR
ncbi:MAG: MG2 domain-containing protein [Beijerinckiaceae bacterium]